ncbi:MAG: exodeoxyribonuclease III [Planctomycetota bacterium]
MKTITWNVNSIRTRLERTLALLQRHSPDILCIQETKAPDDRFPEESFQRLGYHTAAHGQKTYNGVAILSKEPPADVQRGFPGDPIPDHARVISADFGSFQVINAYVVNGKAVGDPKFALKLEWLRALQSWIKTAFDPSRPLLLLGDFNIAPEDQDVHDPEKWRGKVLCSAPERERLAAFFRWGFVDLYRRFPSKGDPYTWWDYRMGAFHRGWGLRIDLVLGTPPLAETCRSVEILREERKASSGEGKPSDHAPVLATFGI